MSEQPTNDPGPDVDENDPKARGLWFANVHDFVVRYLTPSWVRRIDRETNWCRQWYRHPEAHARLDALWRSFEAHRVSSDANAMAIWWRDFADPTMSALTRRKGPFEQCHGDTGEHHDTSDEVWVTDPPPRGMFSDERTVAAKEFADYDD
ncbi:DUF4913 domain-containing protein [Brachybacterium sp. UNK5269]|uniref:DUF4913 domain-containing protein n=1 Tax=Brachybacterium sp. UNK5269 TaxID=3408576 RepID=UPI003BB134EC